MSSHDDDTEDFLGLDVVDPAERLPALVVGRPATTEIELRLMEEMHRFGGAKHPGSTSVVFVETTEDGAEEFLSEAEALKWQGIMRWPYPPDLDAVLAFQRHQQAKLKEEYWDRCIRVQAN
jgi:hypothetical protein